MATYGFATGSNLTDLGRNLVAQEQTRNALQAALAAAAAQQGVARTQAGASRYSTDAQREGNQLMAMLRGLEQDRLREATDTEAGLKRRDLELRDAIAKLQYAPNMPEAMTATRAHEIALANIAAAAQRDINSRVPPQVRREELGLIADADEFNSRIDGAIARANTESDILYDTIIGGRKNYFGLGTSEDEAKRQYVAKAITEVPLKLGEFAPYLIPHEVGGRIRFSAKRRSVPGLSIGGNGFTQAQPLPVFPAVLDEVESALGGSTVPAVPVRPLNVPRGTNNVPTLPMLPVAPDTEPGFFSRLGQGAIKAATGPTALIGELLGRLSVGSPSAPMAPPVAPGQTQAGRTIENILRERNAAMVPSAPPTESIPRAITQAAPFPELVPIALGPPYYETRPEKVREGIGRYIENLLGEANRTQGQRRAAILQELSRIRQLAGQLN